MEFKKCARQVPWQKTNYPKIISAGFECILDPVGFGILTGLSAENGLFNLLPETEVRVSLNLPSRHWFLWNPWCFVKVEFFKSIWLNSTRKRISVLCAPISRHLMKSTSWDWFEYISRIHLSILRFVFYNIFNIPTPVNLVNIAHFSIFNVNIYQCLAIASFFNTLFHFLLF